MQEEPKAHDLWLVRHGQRQDTDPQWRPEVCQHTEVPLSPLGLAQAKALGQRLTGVPIDHLFCSPFLRAVESANAIAAQTGHCIKIEHGAMEWQNIEYFPYRPPLLTVGELAARFPRIDEGYASLVTPVWPETNLQARERLGNVINLLVSKFSGSLLIVGHGMTVLGMAGALLNPPYEGVDDVLCGIVRLQLQRDGRWKLRLNGDSDHLKDLGGALH